MTKKGLAKFQKKTCPSFTKLLSVMKLRLLEICQREKKDQDNEGNWGEGRTRLKEKQMK